MKILNKLILLAGVAILMSGCSLYKKYELPADSSAIVEDYRKSVQSNDTTGLPYLHWDQVFTDPLLQSYIRRALENNKNLNNAKLNIDIAHAQLKGAKLSYFPSLAFNPTGAGAKYEAAQMNWTYTVPLAANWEVDVFGKLLNTKRKAKVSEEMAEDYRQAVQSQIVTGVANTYYAIVLLQQQLDLSKRTAEIWKEQVESMELMKQAARVNEAAVVQSRANYYSILASIPDLENSIIQYQNTLSLLMNTYPQTWEVTQSLDFQLPVAVSEGVAMNYLAARPDVRAAERDMAVAYYATNLARANFYPSLNISAQGGFTNAIGSFISNPGKWFIQLAASLAAPIFSRGKNIAQLEVAKAQQKQSLNNFEYTVLSAAADVSDAYAALRNNEVKRQAVEQQILALEKSVEYTSELLTFGQGTYLEVLTARSSLLSAQMSALSCWHSKVSALISLYAAVGGGRM